MRAVRRAVDRWGGLLDSDRAVLAHGDLGASHIYHRDGQYTGIIDLGEVRGADPLYDLGHAALHDGETITAPLLPGYAEIAPLPPDAGPRIHLWSLLIGTQRLTRLAGRLPSPYAAHLVATVKRATGTLA